MEEDVLKINDLDKLKFTSITNVIHFKYDEEHYYIHEDTSGTSITALYKGRCKYKNKCLKSKYGWIPNLIKYKFNKRTLNAIDKLNFVKKLYKAGLIDTNNEIKIMAETELEEQERIRKQIHELEQRQIELMY